MSSIKDLHCSWNLKDAQNVKIKYWEMLRLNWVNLNKAEQAEVATLLKS